MTGIQTDTTSFVAYRRAHAAHAACRTAAFYSRWVNFTPASRESREISVVVNASRAFEGVNSGLVCVFLDTRARAVRRWDVDARWGA